MKDLLGHIVTEGQIQYFRPKFYYSLSAVHYSLRVNASVSVAWRGKH